MEIATKRYNVMLFIFSIILGVLVGVSSGLLGILLNLVEKIFLNYNEVARYPAPVNGIPIFRLYSVAVGGIISAIIWWIIREKYKKPISINQALSGDKMPFISTLIHVITQIFYVGTGGSIGRELAPREAGTLIAQSFENRIRKLNILKLELADRQLLLAAAAGAGFSGVYLAPITGALFSVELLLKKFTFRTVSISLLMTSVSMLVGGMFKGFKPYYIVNHTIFSAAGIIIVLAFAPLMGIMGGLFRLMFQSAGKHKATGYNILWMLPLVSIATGIIAIYFPEIMGNGRSLMQLSVFSESHNMIVILFIGLILKMIVTLLTIRAGASGGTLTPSIAIGGSAGAIIGIICSWTFMPSISVDQMAILGAVTFLAASQQAPLMALFMMIEITHIGYSWLLPMFLGVIVSLFFSRLPLKYKR
ncbi:chloride channel protein [Leuconostoc sp. UCMA20149]|uniref:chloride channel protein n=1 Tax=Leuconostoc sp. UCMA20149 TaxID=2583528 RepID=UPI0025AFF2ED|nr:chloride channel protein [Leuconostoc sp. UCMA20149]MDN2451446.1 chloride channel protein [Leuconostoc sp. UCMA20149]